MFHRKGEKYFRGGIYALPTLKNRLFGMARGKFPRILAYLINKTPFKGEVSIRTGALHPLAKLKGTNAFTSPTLWSPLILFLPQVFNIPKVEHDQPCSTLVVIVFQISLFIYVILGPDWSMAKVKVNKQTNLQKQ